MLVWRKDRSSVNLGAGSQLGVTEDCGQEMRASAKTQGAGAMRRALHPQTPVQMPTLYLLFRWLPLCLLSVRLA